MKSVQHRNKVNELSNATRVAFGSTQVRQLIPTHPAPSHMGIEDITVKNPPTPGPGYYNNHEVGTILYELKRKPTSLKGYATRTAPRFNEHTFQSFTPSPQEYQPDWSASQTTFPGKVTFSTTPRFLSKCTTDSSNPGPGTYKPGDTYNRKVSWPMKFGSPDWSQVPKLQHKALHTKLPSEKEFQKHRNRVAYLSLYYS